MKVAPINREMNKENFEKVAETVNKTMSAGLTLEDNMSCKIVRNVQLRAHSSDEDPKQYDTISHGLGSIPKFVTVANQKGMAMIEFGEHDRYNAKVRASAATTVDLMFFRG